jgi:hypothetical protein
MDTQVPCTARVAELVEKTQYIRAGAKTTVCLVTLKNGFEVIGTSACVNPANFDEKVGEHWALKAALDKIEELEGFHRQMSGATCSGVNPGTVTFHDTPPAYVLDGMSLGVALEFLKTGHRVARKGWNGKGIFLELRRPDEHSKMTQPYIYIDTTGLVTNNPDAPKGRVPWLASQTDLLAEDWVIVE